MILIDSSALVAIITDENDRRYFSSKICLDAKRYVTPAVVWEVVVNLARKQNLTVPIAKAELEVFLDALQITIVLIPSEAGFVAVDAYDRFGKGHHPAVLNFGDCLSYATARLMQEPLLFKGDVFRRTDILAA